MEYKKASLIGIAMVLLLGFAFSVSASGVSSPYWDAAAGQESMSMKINPGQTVTFDFTLSNTVGANQDLVFKASVEDGQGIATLVDPTKQYTVPFGSEDITVPAKVTVPSDTPVGTTYVVKYYFQSAPATQNGMLTFGSGYTRQFTVQVVEVPKPAPVATVVNTSNTTPEEKNGMSIWLIVLIVAVVILLVIVLIKAFSKKK